MSGKPRDLDLERTTPLGMMRYAIEFFAASVAVDDRFGSQERYLQHAPIPALFLIARSMELALKAYSLEKTRTCRFGHDLVWFLTKPEAAGLIHNLSDADRSLVVVINRVYKTKQLEYRAA